MKAITGGQSSSGTLNVAPSGGSCVVGEEGDPVCPCILRNCFATLPFHVLVFGETKVSIV